ncbi:MAG TPA: GNAT family N-acetyltransferase [Roseiarcus sp.]
MSVSTRFLRDFAEADLPALIDLWAAAWTATGIPIDFDARRPWLDERLRALEAGGVEIVVALGVGGKPVGFVTIDPRSGALDLLCVAPAERGSGLASALIDEAKRRSPGVVDLEVNEANPRARRFYQREGFTLIGRGMSPHSRLPTLNMRWLEP